MPDFQDSRQRLSPEKHPNSPHIQEEEDDDITPSLPPLYSPRPIPVSRAISELDLNHHDPDQNAEPLIAPHPYKLSSQNHGPPTQNLPEEPLPGLVSPAFTPPSTPGSSTPSLAPKPIPGIAVDSSLPSEASNCGARKPKLLPQLPEVNCVVRARIPTVTGTEMWLHLYTNNVDNKEHLAIVFGNNIRSKSLDRVRPGETEMDRMIRGAYVGRLFPGRTTSGMAGPQSAATEAEKEEETEEKKKAALVRIHSECYTGETAWSARCDCGEQLDEAARLMSLPSEPNGGIIIYLRQEGRGIGLGEKLKAYNLQDLGNDTVEANILLRHPADARSYGLATAMLRDLGQREIRLLTNNPDKVRAVEGPGREVVVRERVPMVPLAWRGKGGIRSQEVGGYLKTKIEKMGHMLDMASQEEKGM